MMRRFGPLLCLVITSVLLGQHTASAAVLYFDPDETAINPGDTVVMAVRVTPEADECINVIDAVIEYDPQVQPVDLSRGQSIMPLWVEEPTIDRENSRITFAGGIPNGYCGRIQGDPRLTNEVLKIVFQVPGMRVGFGDESPTSTVRFSDQTAVYLNDGRGSLAQLSTTDAQLRVGKRPGTEVRNEWSRLVNADEQMPEEFSVTLQQDESIFRGDYYIVFNTTDKQTGVAYYEVIEEPLEEAGVFGWGAVDAPWQRTRSPYVLDDQSLNSTIRVKAVDKAGNEYIATLVPDESMRGISLTTYIEYVILALGALALLGVGTWVGYRLLPVLARSLRGRRERAQAKVAAATDEDADEYEYVEEWVEVEVDEDGNEINDEQR